MHGVVRVHACYNICSPCVQDGIHSSRGVASSKQVRGPQHNILAIANVNQDIETAPKQDKSEGAMAPLGPIVATPVHSSAITSSLINVNNEYAFTLMTVLKDSIVYT